MKALAYDGPSTEDLWISNVTITTDLVGPPSTPTLLPVSAVGRFNTMRIATHCFALSEREQAYKVFSRPPDTGALTGVLHRD